MSRWQKSLSDPREIGQRNLRGSPKLFCCSELSQAPLSKLVPLANTLPCSVCSSWPLLTPQPVFSPSPWPAPLPAPCFSARPSCQGTDQLKIVPTAFLAHSCPKSRKWGGGRLGGPCPALTHRLWVSSTPVWGECQFGHLWGIPHPSPRGKSLLLSAYNHRVAPALWEKKGGHWSPRNPSQFLTNQCQPHCGH